LGAFANRRNGHEQGRRGTNDNFRLSGATRGHGLANRGRFGEAFAQTVHLPIARNEGALSVGHAESFRLFRGKPRCMRGFIFL
jgi:hypothetical protein